MTRPELIEVLARAMCNNWKNAKYYGDQWPDVCAKLPGQAADFRDKANDALAAIEAQGLAILPVEATEQMAEIGTDARWRSAVRNADNVREIYSAMIAAGRI